MADSSLWMITQWYWCCNQPCWQGSCHKLPLAKFYDEPNGSSWHIPWCLWDIAIISGSCQNCCLFNEYSRPLWMEWFVCGTKRLESEFNLQVYIASCCATTFYPSGKFWGQGVCWCAWQCLTNIVVWKFSYSTVRWEVSICHMILSSFKLFCLSCSAATAGKGTRVTRSKQEKGKCNASSAAKSCGEHAFLNTKCKNCFGLSIHAELGETTTQENSNGKIGWAYSESGVQRHQKSAIEEVEDIGLSKKDAALWTKVECQASNGTNII